MKRTTKNVTLLYTTPDGTETSGQLLAGAEPDVVTTQANRYGLPFGVGGTGVKETFVWANISDFVAPPPPTSSVKFGVHLLTEAQNGDGFNMSPGVYPASLGCQSYLVFGGVVGAWELRERTGKPVVYRPLSSVPSNAMPNAASVIEECRFYIEKGNAIVTTGLNECDQQGGNCGQIVAKINERAAYEREFLDRAKAINSSVTVLAGSWPYGTPDFTQQAICDAVNAGYASRYNSGAWKVNIHLYSPDMNHIDQPSEWKWFERRWEWLFTKCGFDPNVKGIWCDEGGLDQPGFGGYRQHADAGLINAQWVGDHCAKIVNCQHQPLIVNGVSYPTPVEVYDVFQFKCGLAPCEPGCQGCWYGYDISWCINDVARGLGWQR